ncbi:MAG: sn-glycerol-3-phosphate ABC transporter ATP-binding protein UgpC [Candidatus Omnitrophica bacterium]|nr:sn-glycerol-3-phosphate ABC transporter ATP-binding protein UgpC [Candidatus Omnitrophota bacterium]
MAKIEVRNLTKIYDNNVVAVKDLTFSVEDKEFLVILGPSGCGKSTTLRLIAGLESPTKGDIYIQDRWVNDIAPKDRNIAMVFQNYALYPHMSAYDNMAFSLKLRRYSKKEIDSRIKEVASILNIEKLLDRKPAQLSGGERQRVALGRAIVRKPLAFLFDEPLSNLDAKMRAHMRAELSKLFLKLQATVIYVTHDQTEAMTLGHRIAVIRDGKLLQLDTPMNIYNYPANKFVAGFVGFQPMNFFEGKIIKKDGGLYFYEGSFTVKIPEAIYSKLKDYIEKTTILGIRPENIYDKLFMSNAIPDNTILAICEFVETIGSANFLYLSTEKHTFVAVTATSNKPTISTAIEIVFDMNKVHFFEPSTEKTIV